MEDKLYSIEEIKMAFWKTFLKSGEWWFNYLKVSYHHTDEEYEKDCNDDVEHAWRGFIENLNGK